MPCVVKVVLIHIICCTSARFHMVVKGPLAFVWWRIALMIILIKNEFIIDLIDKLNI